jgi:hypothetical protein
MCRCVVVVVVDDAIEDDRIMAGGGGSNKILVWDETAREQDFFDTHAGVIKK